MTNHPRSHMLARISWRLLLVATAFSLALVALLAGVYTTERPSLAEADLLTRIYSALGLFVFGGIDLGTPAGGPAWARGLLWTAYFLCPLITAAAVIEGILALLRPVPWRLKDHIVLAGCGEVALLYLRELRQQQPHQKVVAVLADGDVREADEIRHLGAHVLVGDIGSEAVLTRLDLHRARRVLLLSEDDLANLEAAWRVHTAGVTCPVVAHVGDLALRRDLASMEQMAGIRVFNGFELAAEHVASQQIFAELEKDQKVDVIVIAGFGRFGQALLDALHRQRHDAFHHVIIVDRTATRAFHAFREQIPVADYRIETVNADISDPDVWAALEEHLREDHERPVIVLGTDNERLNLHVAMVHARHYRHARTLVRVSSRAGLATLLAAAHRFDVIDPSDHMRESLCHHDAFGIGASGRRAAAPSPATS